MSRPKWEKRKPKRENKKKKKTAEKAEKYNEASRNAEFNSYLYIYEMNMNRGEKSKKKI